MKFLQFADLHLIGTMPICRQDEDWINSQRKDIQFLVKTANENKVPLIGVGDIFDTARVATEVVNMAIDEFSKVKFGVQFLCGNHDLPTHCYDLLYQSSIGTLLKSFSELKSGKVEGEEWAAFPFGNDERSTAKIRFIHRLIFPDEQSRPVDECGQTAQELLEEFPEQDWILTGDYHHAFHYKEGNRHVVNTGCVNVQKADFIGYQPKVAIVDTIAGTVEWINVPQRAEFKFGDEYLVEAKEREARMESFFELARNKDGVCISFSENLEINMQKNPLSVQQILIEIRQGVKNESK
jgi:DNA repair exonuclease SbcCD nuclease subunit